MLCLCHHRSNAPGLADLMNWSALIGDGIVQGKDGSLIAGFFYRPPDIASSTDDERNALCERINRALAPHGAGFALWIEAARIDVAGYPAPEASHFPDPISRLVDDERRQQFEREGSHFESEYALLVTYTPPMRRNRRIEDLIYDKASLGDAAPASRILEQFEKDLAAIEDAIGDAVNLRRMRSFTVADADGSEHLSDELVNYLNFTLTGELVTLKIPAAGIYLDALLGMEDFWKGETPLLGEKYIAAVTIDGFPQASYPQCLDALDHLEFAYRWSTRFILLDQHESVSELQKYHRKWRQRIRGFVAQMFRTQGGVINEDALLMTQEAQAALGLAHGEQVAYGYLTTVVVLMDADPERLRENAHRVVREIKRAGFSARIETTNTVPAWHGTLPGHPLPNVRRPPSHTDHLANLMPLSSVWPGDPVHPNPMYPPGSPPLLYARTTGATPFRISHHSGDVGHTLVFGPTGSGKSTLLATTALQALRYPGATICCFDKGRSLWAVANACGGRHYDIAGDGSPAFCPLSVLETETDLAWAEDWIATCFELQHGQPLTPDQRDAIHRAMLLLRAGGERTITHFIAAVQDEAVRAAMQYYSLAGAMGYLLDAEADGLADSHLTVFEIGELLPLDDRAKIPVLLYLFRRFERALRGQPAYLIIDEAWAALGNELIRPKIVEWLKGLRKLCCSVILATQSISDASRSGIIDVLVESCPTKIFLPNPEAENTISGALYAAMGLNETQIAIIKHATPKRHYYLVSPEGCRLFDLGLGPIALAFAGVSDPKVIAHLDELARRHGDEWPCAWLEEKGVEIEQPYSAAAE